MRNRHAKQSFAFAREPTTTVREQSIARADNDHGPPDISIHLLGLHYVWVETWTCLRVEHEVAPQAATEELREPIQGQKDDDDMASE